MKQSNTLLSRARRGYRFPVELLVQEKAGLLAVFHIHVIGDAVFRDGGSGGAVPLPSGEKALVLLQPLPLPQGNIVALVDSPDILPILPQNLAKQGEQPAFALLHAQGKGLGHQDIAKAVHGQSGKLSASPKITRQQVRS